MELEWRLVNSGYQDAFVNMATDEAILLAHSKGLVPPTLRFYCWRPPGVSIGYFQYLEESVDVKRCHDLGIDIVRRPTGGKALLHDKEVTYSVVVSENILGKGLGVLECYERLSLGLVAGLRLLGVEAELSSRQAIKGRKVGNKGKKLSLCLVASSVSDVSVGGRKIVGSAQLHKNGVVLQHGSILIDIDKDSWLSIFLPQKRTNEPDLLSHSTFLNEILGRQVTLSEVVTALVIGFEKSLNVKLIGGELIREEKNYIRELVSHKYKTTQWNYIRPSKRDLTY